GRQLLAAARSESLRNRLMLALAYDAGLRREELCSLAISDIDFSQRLLSIRAETTKNRQARVVPYSAATGELLAAWLRRRREMSRRRGHWFSQNHDAIALTRSQSGPGPRSSKATLHDL